jgi:flagellar hook assembly protein FlgD
VHRLRFTNTQVVQGRTTSGATVLCGVSVPADVTLRLRTAGGRLIRTIGPAHVSGAATISWDGRDDRGRLLPGGIYIGELYAEGQDGQRLRAIVTIRTRD